jgi:adenylate cyclase
MTDPNAKTPETPNDKICRLTAEVDGRREEIDVADRGIIIGRAHTADYVLRHESVSRHHARIVPSHRGWELIDLNSKNHVRLNTYQVSRGWLHDGDRLDIGVIQVEVTLVEPAHSEPPVDVIFQEDSHRKGLQTEVIDMDHMDLLFVPGSDLAREPELDSGVAGPPSMPETQSGQQPAIILGLVNDAAEALLSCETLDETLDRILALVFGSVPAERGVICLYDEDEDQLDPKVMRTAHGASREPIVISNQIARSAIEQKRSLLVKDTMMDNQFGGAHSVIMMQIQSAMCAPLYRAGRVVGVVYVDRVSSKEAFETHHLQALSALATLSAIAVEQSTLRDDIRREHEIRSRLERYSSPNVVDRIIASSGEMRREMVADEGDVSVLFADLTGFTAMAENLRPFEVIQVLNQVFERLSGAVFDYEGTLDKFRGDGMMAFFGAPLAQADHAERAVKAALRMQALLADINADTHNRRFVSMRIGINSGPVVVGDIGSPQRKDYTVIGDVVNIASRLESSVAQPGQVVIGPRTYRLVAPAFACQELEAVRLKGRIRTVRPYLVQGPRDPAHES